MSWLGESSLPQMLLASVVIRVGKMRNERKGSPVGADAFAATQLGASDLQPQNWSRRGALRGKRVRCRGLKRPNERTKWR